MRNGTRTVLLPIVIGIVAAVGVGANMPQRVTMPDTPIIIEFEGGESE